MATAHLYSLAKRHNSTLQPTGQGTQVTLTLKGGSDILTPTFLLNASSMPTDNYILFEGRYYFVTGIKSVRHQLWEISAVVDVLATYKGIIQATSAYVLYYDHINLLIADRRLSVKATRAIQTETGSFGFLGKNYCYVLTVIGRDQTASFILTESQIRSLYGSGSNSYMDVYETSLNDLMLNYPVTGNDVKEVIIDFARWICDFLKTSAGAFNYAGTISDNIKSCMILPVAAGAFPEVLLCLKICGQFYGRLLP